MLKPPLAIAPNDTGTENLVAAVLDDGEPAKLAAMSGAL